MIKARLLFVKEGTASYISHLDLMHTLQRIFIRGGIPVRHTEGFNPHPYMSIILPLSVGHESECELMDFDLVDDSFLSSVAESFNRSAPSGLKAIEAYPRERKGADLKWLRIKGTLSYNDEVKAEDFNRLKALFSQKEIIVPKRTKKGETLIDLVPNLGGSELFYNGKNIVVDAVLSAQEPSINPESLISAIVRYAPDIKPDFAQFRRMEIYDKNMTVFR